MATKKSVKVAGGKALKAKSDLLSAVKKIEKKQADASKVLGDAVIPKSESVESISEAINKAIEENVMVSDDIKSVTGFDAAAEHHRVGISGTFVSTSEPLENVVTISETSPSKLAIEDAVKQLTEWFENGTTRGQILELRNKLKSV
jgi:hypothetical protein